MRFLKEIFIKLTNWSSFLFSIEKKIRPNSVMKEKGEKKKKVKQKIDRKKEVVREIVQDQIKERDIVVKKNNSTKSRVSELSLTQKKLIKKKLTIKNKNFKKVSVFNLEELAYQLELLETNLQLQKTKRYKPQPKSSESILNLKKDIREYEHSTKNLANTIQEKRLIIKELRGEDKSFIIKKRENIFKFSLIELFKESERKKEIERIELQKKEEKRIQNLKFDKSIKKAKKLIEAYDFDSAEKELKNALSINYLRHKAVNNLKDEILRLKSQFERKQAQFKIVFEKANIQMKNQDYENALKTFNLSKLYGTDSEEVDKKITLVKSYIRSQKINEENFIKEKDSFLIEINNKSFIRAKRKLTAIIENFKDKVAEIESFHKILEESKLTHKKVKARYKKDIEKAETYFLNKNYKQAISVFKKCLSLNINNKFCENRIRVIKHQESIELQKQKLQEKKSLKEKQRLAELDKYKREKEEILQFLRANGITKFYHFTDESNISSIMLNGGLYSWGFCDNNNIVINKPGGDNMSRSLDLKYNLENFVRLSFAKEHPMQYVALRENRLRSIRNLEIDIQTAAFKNTLFSNMNATKNGHAVGEDLNFLKNEIKFDIIKQPKYYNLLPEDKPFYQAEIMVEEYIESKYIINL
jgi:hypothetical protein